ncbi:MAG TPA: hypothetical protein VKX28_26930 [Xanthobacteraceae bacterium]|nr:hypothetical protein [Xanthobacteraceae bacterium]
MKLKRLSALAATCVVAFGIYAANAAGLWSTLPIIGGASYCAAVVGAGPSQAGVTGQGAGSVGGSTYCAQTVPAGPSVFAGTEMVPLDIYTPGPQASAPPTTALANIVQLGQGPMVDVTSPVTATIPANTPFYFLDGAQASAFTITMPAAPIEGYIQRITCAAATVGVLTVAANANQSIKNNPAAACVAGVGYAWRYQASNTTWYRFQ